MGKKKTARQIAAKVEKILKAREQIKINEMHKKSGYTGFLRRTSGSFGSGKKK